MKNIFILLMSMFSSSIFAQEIVNIPDSNLKAAILNQGIDTNGNGEIESTEALNFSGTLDISNQNISSLEGLEAFQSISTLNCSNNQITDITVLADMSSLSNINCSYNQITVLPEFYTLENFDASHNEISSVNGYYNCSGYINLSYNKFTSLDLRYAFATISSGDFSNNLISNVVFGDFSGFYEIDLSNNKLSSLDLSSVEVTYKLDLTGNEDLTCVSISTESSDYDMFITADEGVGFSEDCAMISDNVSCDGTVIQFADSNLKSALLAQGKTITGDGISILDTNDDGEICSTEVLNYDGKIDISNQNITSLEGLEAFQSINTLDCSNNQLTDITTLKDMRTLGSVDCSYNQITLLPTLDFLSDLNASHNEISSIEDYSNFTGDINLSYNQLTSLNFRNDFSFISSGDFSNNLISTVSFYDAQYADNIDLSNNKLESLDLSAVDTYIMIDVTGNEGLTCINVSADAIAYGTSVTADEGVGFSEDCAFLEEEPMSELPDLVDFIANETEVTFVTKNEGIDLELYLVKKDGAIVGEILAKGIQNELNVENTYVLSVDNSVMSVYQTTIMYELISVTSSENEVLLGTYNYVTNIPEAVVEVVKSGDINENGSLRGSFKWQCQNNCEKVSRYILQEQLNGGSVKDIATIDPLTGSVYRNVNTYEVDVDFVEDAGYRLVTVTTDDVMINSDYIKPNANVFPVELTSFTVKAKGNDVQLSWNTLSEVNNSHFNIQRSLDGETFETIASVNGNGTSTDEQSYSYTDYQVSNSGIVYYRLEQVDLDGQANLLEVKSVNFTSSIATELYPTLVVQGQGFTVSSADIRTIRVYNTVGVPVSVNTYNNASRVNISTNGLTKGVYFVNVNNEKTLKLIVE